MKLLVFGNPAIPRDTLALTLAEELRSDGYTILHLEDPLGLLELNLDEYVILDVAQGIERPVLLTDPDRLTIGRLCSLHDFDMAYFLKLLKELGKVSRVRILAVPMAGDVQELLPAVRAILATLQ